MGADERLAAGDERGGEVGEDAGQHVARQVEQGPPAEHAAQRRGRQVEGGRRGDVEAQAGVLPAGVLDHPRGQVDAGDVEAEAGQVRGDGAGAAADVEDRAEVPYVLGEGTERGPQPRVRLQADRGQPDVGVGDGVVRVPDELEIGGLRHPHTLGTDGAPDAGPGMRSPGAPPAACGSRTGIVRNGG